LRLGCGVPRKIAFPGSSMIELPFVVKDAASGSRALWDLLQDGTWAHCALADPTAP
jgi:hypothetical protein